MFIYYQIKKHFQEEHAFLKIYVTTQPLHQYITTTTLSFNTVLYEDLQEEQTC